MHCGRDILLQKEMLRKKFLNMRLKLNSEDVNLRSKKVLQNLATIESFILAKNVLIYYPFKNEVNVLILLTEYLDKNFYFPVVDFENKQLKVRKYTGVFCENRYGIKEPVDTSDNSKDIIDFVIVPGIVFDKNGYRIGYGGGYYDRFLSSFSNPTCGVCFDEQIVDELPRCDYDVKLNYIVSDKRIIRT